jgi:hypothetical protein
MMIVEKLGSAGEPYAVGATLGQHHLNLLLERVLRTPGTSPSGEGETLVLDLSNFTAVTQSYLKSTLAPLFAAAGETCGSHNPRLNNGSIRLPPLNIWVLVTGSNEEVTGEVDDFCWRVAQPCLLATQLDQAQVSKAQVLGPLEGVLRDTLEIVTDLGEVTATELHDRFPNDAISVTGWNNRLAELFKVRLTRREKAGRQFVYRAVSKEIIDG